MPSRTGCVVLAAASCSKRRKIGHSEDVCTYVKSDIGMMAKGNIAPNGKKFPNPDVLCCSPTPAASLS